MYHSFKLVPGGSKSRHLVFVMGMGAQDPKNSDNNAFVKIGKQWPLDSIFMLIRLTWKYTLARTDTHTYARTHTRAYTDLMSGTNWLKNVLLEQYDYGVSCLPTSFSFTDYNRSPNTCTKLLGLKLYEHVFVDIPAKGAIQLWIPSLTRPRTTPHIRSF